jgi:hypothetical protein
MENINLTETDCPFMNIRSTRLLLLWTLPLLLATLACRAVTSITPHDTVPSSSPSQPYIPVTALATTDFGANQEASCPATVGKILTAAITPGQSKEPDPEVSLATYKVTGEQISDPVFDPVPADLKSEQDNFAAQQYVWTYFTSLIPEENRRMVSNYAVLTDGQANLLAAVAPTSSDPSHWTLEVDIADATDYANLTFTMIHEFGHLLTLNADQVPPSSAVFSNPHDKNIHNQEVAACPNYFTGEGCSNSGSYINQYYQRFWKDIYAEWSQIDQIENQHDYYEKLTQFYQHYEDRFVSEYATANPGEDIAESWAFFVLGPKPTGNTVADQKVLFFYEHPELVQLRAQILTRLCTVFPNK